MLYIAINCYKMTMHGRPTNKGITLSAQLPCAAYFSALMSNGRLPLPAMYARARYQQPGGLPFIAFYNILYNFVAKLRNFN